MNININIETPSEKTFASNEQIEEARAVYGSDEVEIDDVALTSVSDEGVWVQAWVWLPKDEDGDETEKESK